MSDYKIQVGSEVVNVDYYIFRSWTGPRWLRGNLFHGPVYILGTNETASGRMYDKCRDCGVPLFLREDYPNDDPSMWEDDNDGYCGNCI